MSDRLPDLFAAPFVASGSATSRAAAERATRFASTQRGRVVAYLDKVGIIGATRAEIAVALDIKENSVNGRVWELMTALPNALAYELGERRDGRAVVVGAAAWRLLMESRTRNARTHSEDEQWPHREH